jgi:hypothetical protein
MRYVLLILTFFIYCNTFAQADKSLEKAIAGFNAALINKDSVTLKKLVSDKIVYGHSNGWKQTKRELIDDLYNGKIIYKVINSADEQVTTEGNTACVRATLGIDVVMEGKDMHFKLHALQVWIKKNKDWQMLSRQSIKL